ncbi:MAG TPA: YfiR family protein, partial [Terriglobales bacterium]|nr:YfiR family protein [Terriglobales bacterium]
MWTAETAAWLLWPTLAITLLLGAARAQSGRPTEYQVKAAFLYHFAKFVEWPPDAFPRPSAPLHLCVFGEDPFGGELERFANEKTVAGHPLRVLQPKRIEQAK